MPALSHRGLLVLFLVGCHEVVPGGEGLGTGVPVGRGAWQLAVPGTELRLDPGGTLSLWLAGRFVRTIHDEVLPGPQLTPARDRVVYARRPPADGALWVADPVSGERRALSTGGAACLPLVAPDGRRVVFVDTASDSGVAALFVVPVDGSRPPRQLTNRGLRRVPGRRPYGYLPPPDGPEAMRWTAAGLELLAGARRHLVPVGPP